ncbi:MAG TPA: hypothetical protein VHU61_10415 [Solirubrobacteraceae bacterium]|jgi:hypothetical protein|nr:hypothetical protein [Solirubrobacteraceae bacterium]
MAAAAPRAYADGDPASDVLTSQKLFLPTDANVPVHEQLDLSALLNESSRKGYPLRVAIIGSASDLGSVTPFWRQPGAYARFLGGELSLVYHGTVLVVMPNGYGSDVTAAGTRTASGETRLPLPGHQLGGAAIVAVEQFAKGAQTPLTRPVVHTRVIARPSARLPWLVVAVGLLPALAAWGLSLRRRPLRLRPRQG